MKKFKILTIGISLISYFSLSAAMNKDFKNINEQTNLINQPNINNLQQNQNETLKTDSEASQNAKIQNEQTNLINQLNINNLQQNQNETLKTDSEASQNAKIQDEKKEEESEKSIKQTIEQIKENQKIRMNRMLSRSKVIVNFDSIKELFIENLKDQITKIFNSVSQNDLTAIENIFRKELDKRRSEIANLNENESIELYPVKKPSLQMDKNFIFGITAIITKRENSFEFEFKKKIISSLETKTTENNLQLDENFQQNSILYFNDNDMSIKISKKNLESEKFENLNIFDPNQRNMLKSFFCNISDENLKQMETNLKQILKFKKSELENLKTKTNEMFPINFKNIKIHDENFYYNFYFTISKNKNYYSLNFFKTPVDNTIIGEDYISKKGNQIEEFKIAEKNFLKNKRTFNSINFLSDYYKNILKTMFENITDKELETIECNLKTYIRNLKDKIENLNENESITFNVAQTKNMKDKNFIYSLGATITAKKENLLNENDIFTIKFIKFPLQYSNKNKKEYLNFSNKLLFGNDKKNSKNNLKNLEILSKKNKQDLKNLFEKITEKEIKQIKDELEFKINGLKDELINLKNKEQKIINLNSIKNIKDGNYYYNLDAIIAKNNSNYFLTFKKIKTNYNLFFYDDQIKNELLKLNLLNPDNTVTLIKDNKQKNAKIEKKNNPKNFKLSHIKERFERNFDLYPFNIAQNEENYYCLKFCPLTGAPKIDFFASKMTKPINSKMDIISIKDSLVENFDFDNDEKIKLKKLFEKNSKIADNVIEELKNTIQNNLKNFNFYNNSYEKTLYFLKFRKIISIILKAKRFDPYDLHIKDCENDKFLLSGTIKFANNDTMFPSGIKKVFLTPKLIVPSIKFSEENINQIKELFEDLEYEDKGSIIINEKRMKSFFSDSIKDIEIALKNRLEKLNLKPISDLETENIKPTKVDIDVYYNGLKYSLQFDVIYKHSGFYFSNFKKTLKG